jgi:formylglycine-generating enzyme required for sulfatase activity
MKNKSHCTRDRWQVIHTRLVAVFLATVVSGVSEQTAHADGVLRCWGSNQAGQCNTPADVGQCLSVATGKSFTAAVRSDGTVRCWGDNYQGQCNTPTDLGSCISVAAGSNHSVALRTDGTVQCWGWNLFGDCDTPTDLGPCISVAAGIQHSVALRSDGVVRCWGDNGAGQCVTPSDLGICSSIAAAGAHSIAIRSDGYVRGWGDNSNGMYNTPADLGPCLSVAAGSSHSVALRTDGTVQCWGSVAYGVCNVPGDLGPCLGIAASTYQTVALRANGTVRQWGWNVAGDVPADLGPCTSIAVGQYHTVAIRNMTCAGDLNYDGQVNGSDLGVLLGQWGAIGDTTGADVNHDGTVDGADLGLMLSNWGPCPASVSSILTNVGVVSGGTKVTITGSYLALTKGVSIGGAAANNVVVVNANTLTAISPPGTLGSADVVITSDTETITVPAGFRYVSRGVVPSWATLIEELPDPVFVTNVTMREAMYATGMAWRVRDTSSQIEMLLVPPGEFTMGCSASNNNTCVSQEKPTHSVTLTEAIYIGRYEVTQAQWVAKMGSNPSYYQEPYYHNTASYPVESVSWNMVQGFLNVTGARLPSEAEWEYACRAGTTTAFHNGSNVESTAQTIAVFNNGQPRPGGSKSANALGLCDMSGNVREWVNDWFSSTYYSVSPSTNPTGPASSGSRVLRGGSWWDSGPNIVRSSYRFYAEPAAVHSRQGFRVARNP